MQENEKIDMLCGELDYIKHVLPELISSNIDYDPVEMVNSLVDGINWAIKEAKEQ